MPKRREHLLGYSCWLRSLRRHSRLMVLIVVAGGVLILMMFHSNSTVSTTNATAISNSIALNNAPQEAGVDYSKFKHETGNHARLPCLLCHRRETNAAQLTRPGGSGHVPCAGCHAQQFADPASPVCTICHTDTQSGKLKPFPRLRSFNMRFDHAVHARAGRTTCATCHRPARGGVAMTIPSGLSAHVTCFRCHDSRASSGERDISSCGTCHAPGRHIRMSQAAPAFRVGFSHAKHGRSEGLTCNQCHRVRSGVARKLQVSSPRPLNHHAAPAAFSCMTCHNGKRAFGGDDFSACKRCHTGRTWRF